MAGGALPDRPGPARLRDRPAGSRAALRAPRGPGPAHAAGDHPAGRADRPPIERAGAVSGTTAARRSVTREGRAGLTRICARAHRPRSRHRVWLHGRLRSGRGTAACSGEPTERLETTEAWTLTGGSPLLECCPPERE